MTKKLTHELLICTEKPARYTGGEWNAVQKEWRPDDCHFALSLPDVYEVGMSNLGLAILYGILNRREDTFAERVYAPWRDMEETMRREKIVLASLESKRPLKDFDLWGFSLQYEMIYSNVLNMLNLAAVPLWAKDRGEDAPFIAGGGPCVYNVEPVADFFDFFIVGEGEEVIGEVAAAMVAWKRGGRPGGRKGFLRELLKISGIYVPAFYEPSYDEAGNFSDLKPLLPEAPPIVYKRVLEDLNKIPSVERPLVPYPDIVHNRLMLELFRGCSRGCRFCQAGIAYRPVRERREEKLRDMAAEMIKATGYGEMSLTSLSSADYSCLGRLADDLLQDYKRQKISFSLPSLRIDSFSLELAARLRQVRKSGLTFAPEAGTQRLRDVINKGVTEEDLLTACTAAFRQCWKQVKLYFMLGLPTETDEDVIGIARLARKIVSLYREITGKGGVKITVSASCFVPKPHTPFQWFGQIPLTEFERRQKLLREHIRDKAISFNYHDARLSVLEGAMARGDRRLAAVIYQAWLDGAKFDGWSDLFKYEIWREAFAKCRLDMAYYNERSRDFTEKLPWEITSPGVSVSFLRREWQRALEAGLTEDCRRGKCSQCGVCPTLGVKVMDYAREEARLVRKTLGENTLSPESSPMPTENPRYKYCAKITKGEEIRYLSHLDYMALWQRAMLRAELPLAYSAGFNPHIKMSLASALSLGVASRGEYLEFELTEELAPDMIVSRLSSALPPGAEILQVKLAAPKAPALMALADMAAYEVKVPFPDNYGQVLDIIDTFNKTAAVTYRRTTPKKQREIPVKDFLAAPVTAKVSEGELVLGIKIRITPNGSMKPAELLTVLAEDFGLAIRPTAAKIERLDIYHQGKPLL